MSAFNRAVINRVALNRFAPIAAILALAAGTAPAQSPATQPAAANSPAANSPTTDSAAATDPHLARATEFVTAMRFSDADKTRRVIELTADYLRDLSLVLEQRRAALESLGQSDHPEINLQTAEAWRVARALSVALRDAYVVQLSVLMTPTQVERVKDGITRDAFHHTLQIYDEMIPGLTHAHRAHIVGLLTEMRENAMLEIDAGPQEKWVDKYRGIINNWLTRQGYDFATLSKAYEANRSRRQ